MRYFDNDMDDLFNKAGKDYPLNTGKKDWNAVQKKLAGEEETPPAANSKNNKRYYPLLLLLLMLPAVFFFFNNNVDNLQRENRPAAKNNPNKNEPPISDQQIANKNVTASRQPGNSLNNDNVTNNNTTKNKIYNTNDKTNNAAKNNANNIKNTDNASKRNNTGHSNDTNKNKPTVINQQNTNKNIASATETSNSVNDENVTSKSNDISIRNDATAKNPTKKNLKKTLFPFVLYNENFQQPYSSFSQPPVKDASPASATPTTAEKKPNSTRPSFYFGVMAGPDLSSIKYQEIKNIGSGVGLLLGYRFSPHWSVEASAYWSSKKYYTDGKYFDKTAAGIPAYAEVYYLDGGCKMIELPIDVRYEFTPGKNTFFITGGFNSYFMKKESYEYKADAMGWVYEGYKDYRNSGNKIFSNLQISGGYEHKLFSNIILRVEPYFQVPLRQIGIGSIPITSAGIRIGVLHDTR